jgi:hypothetical protein
MLRLVDAAERAAASWLVYVSIAAADRALGSPLDRAKLAVEQRLRRSAMTSVIVRPDAFQEIHLAPIGRFDMSAERSPSSAAATPNLVGEYRRRRRPGRRRRARIGPSRVDGIRRAGGAKSQRGDQDRRGRHRRRSRVSECRYAWRASGCGSWRGPTTPWRRHSAPASYWVCPYSRAEGLSCRQESHADRPTAVLDQTTGSADERMIGMGRSLTCLRLRYR